jgi:(1->4)-alpha-D-glucan 1-alpha-D-glucosylmutase
MVGVLEHRSRMMVPAVPIATYRVQLTAAFGFGAAANIVPYLKALGITHLYASPILKARAGSTHGYDVVDPTGLNPELGGDEGFARLAAALKAADMGLIVDFVPNHMAVHHADNPWWLDVLEWGRASPHANAFDIDWTALPDRSRVLIPVLGRPYREALEAGEIALRYDAGEGSFSAWYYEHRLPIAPPRYRGILEAAVRHSGAAGGKPARAILDLARDEGRSGHPTHGEAPAFKAALAATAGGADVIAAGLAFFRPATRDRRGTHALHRLLERQAYRLAHWRLASSEINYRRFFDISTLAGLRVEDAKTFRDLHARIAPLIAAGALSGLRLDHIDGLSDPAQYCARLHDMIATLQPKAHPPFLIVVEKILGEGERLPCFKGVDGTTGYEWLNVISHVLLDPAGLPALDRIWREVGGERPFGVILDDAKREVLQKLLASEFRALCGLLSRIAAGHCTTRDIAADRLRAAFEQVIVHFAVYRSYVTAEGAGDADRAVIDRAVEAARARAPAAEGPIFDFVRAALTLDLIAPGDVGFSRTRVLRFARKTQQLTGPVMAKSLEDTAFYRFHRLLALNEVGGDPAATGLSVDAFHRLMRERIETKANGLTATATHDTKRGEDARARLLALAEMPEEWGAAVARWRAANAGFVRHFGARRSPSAAHEYMLYQALLGVWPLDGDSSHLVERFQAYANKAAREGKVETSWLDPDEDYEKGLAGFIADILRDRSGAFVRGVDAFAQRVALLGALNSLSQVALKIAMPGAPDFYQGAELWDLSLVDPDNRRPVDFAARERVLAASPECGDWAALAETWKDGRIKLAVTRSLLAWRRSLGDVFARGDYQPLAVEGPHRDHVVAFARTFGEDAAILVVGRHFAALTDGGRHWPRADTWQGHVVLPGFKLIDAVRTEKGPPVKLALSRAFESIPVAALRARRV